MALLSYRDYTCGGDEITGIFYDPDPNTEQYQLAEQGQLVVYLPTFTGTGKPGDSDNVVGVPTAATQKAFGLLLQDVFKIDQTKYTFVQDMFSSATTACKPVKTVRRGIFGTDWIDPAINKSSIAAGQDVWFSVDGFTNVDSGSEIVGTFGGTVDSNDFVLIKFDIK